MNLLCSYRLLLGILLVAFLSALHAQIPVITSALSANGTEGTAFSYQISASKLATSYGSRGLPAGMSVYSTTPTLLPHVNDSSMT
ncbi:MAG: hypothetical protein ACKOLA_12155 [Spartobacteria bacterium]